MKLEIKNKWIKALRSGDYKQGTHSCKNSNGEYCCLGVLEEIVDGKTSIDSFPGNKTLNELEKEGYCGIPYKDLLSLSILNDNLKLNFNQIADYIYYTIDVDE